MACRTASGEPDCSRPRSVVVMTRLRVFGVGVNTPSSCPEYKAGGGRLRKEGADRTTRPDWRTGRKTEKVTGKDGEELWRKKKWSMSKT